MNFPTKEHCRDGTRIEFEAGLQDLRGVIHDRGISSIALPALGCGNGGLEWAAVRPLIEGKLAHLAGVDVRVYEPG